MGNLPNESSAIEEFAYHASHNLGEPLRKIKSYSDLLEKKIPFDQDEDTADLFRVIKDAGTRMETIIESLLQFVQIDTSLHSQEPINLTDCLDQALLNLKPDLERVEAKIDAMPLPTIVANSDSFVAVFVQIIKNCIQFRPVADPLRISITTAKDQSMHVIKIKDNGIGMQEESRKKSFILFAKGHSRGQAPGSGIGLSICQKIVHSIGGKIEIFSKVDQGTEVMIKLVETTKCGDLGPK